ncbi:hypothetical protein Ahy_A10g051108 isoform C [Arachis hypogaea]|uniref:Uncharacterized protein n=1 Tax=Arachis hypogaea TaxID=3818 RepID=A0A445BBK5_ARAHY|nr:hypothetical protein Ahy_A10g051108 isoform C [Arachis hypogaea]
MAWYIRYS